MVVMPGRMRSSQRRRTVADCAVGAVAINLFMLGLMGQALGLAALTPQQAVALAVPLGVPAAWLAGRWVRRLLDEAGRG